MNKEKCPMPETCDSVGCGGFCDTKMIEDAFNAPLNAADILEAMARTYRERNAVYGDNYKMVGKLMAVLFPQGVPPELVVQDHFHLFELMLVKLSRYAISKLSHQDSIHDLGVYAAMCESITIQLQGEKQ